MAHRGDFPKGHVPWNKGIRIPEEKRGGRPVGIPYPKSEAWKQLMRDKFRDRDVSWLIGRPVSEETRRKIGDAQRGSLGHNWLGGITKASRVIRNRTRAWAIAIKKRDNYTCQICQSTNGPMHADHIIPVRLRPDLMLDLNNGRTLCASCHQKTPTYGGRRIYRPAK